LLAVIAVTFDRFGTGAGAGTGDDGAPLPSWPYVLSPQHSTIPVESRAHV
jgi:hypothetical protein